MRKIFSLFVFTLICYAAQAQTFFVTNTNDSGPGSLRAALSNFSVGQIIFDLPGSSASITISTPLPIPTSGGSSLSSVRTLWLDIHATGTAVYSSGIATKIYTMSGPSPIDVTTTSFGSLIISYSGFYPATYTVTNAFGAGVGSLEWAIGMINNRKVFAANDFNFGQDRIVFNIPQPAPITLGTSGPLYITTPMTIDGTTQPNNGYTGTSPKIKLVGFNTTTGNAGLNVNVNYYGFMYSPSTVITGLEITNFSTGIRAGSNVKIGTTTPAISGNVINGNGTGIEVMGSNVIISNNYVGVDASGAVAVPNTDGIYLNGCSSVTIQKNVISGNTSSGIRGAASGGSIKGNKIGVSANGDVAIPNKIGIGYYGVGDLIENVTIGGPGADRNIISGNTLAGIQGQRFSNCQITNNYIGTDITGLNPIGNGYGIYTDYYFFTNVMIGGNTLAEGNLIAYNNAALFVRSGVNIKNNNIHDNNNGITAILPAPVITSRSTSIVSGTATVNSVVQLFEDNLHKTSPQGNIFIGEVTADASGNWSYSGSFSNPCAVTAICYETSSSKSSAFSATLYDVIPDSSIYCSGSTVTLNIPTTFDTYLWSDASTALPQYSTNAEGKVWVDLNLGSCAYSDTTYVKFVTAPVVNSLGNDTTVCGSIVINMGTTSNATYSWTKDGLAVAGTGSTFNVISSGRYKGTAKIGNCAVSTNTINITVNTIPNIYTNAIYTKCTGASYTLTKPLTSNTYLWSDGSTSNALAVTLPGKYWVRATSPAGCSGSDTIRVNDVTLSVNLGNDTTLCSSQSMVLNATNAGASYTWAYGGGYSYNATYPVYSPGQYNVTVTNGACVKKDTVNITYVVKPVVKLGNDTLTCSALPLTKSFNFASATYNWSDGSHGNSLTFNSAGQYFVEVKVNATCFSRDTINIQVANCSQVSGKVYNDVNANLNLDGADPLLPSYVVSATNGTYTYYCVSDANGRYSFSVPDGNYTLSCANRSSIVTAPVSQHYAVTVNQNLVNTNSYNFGLTLIAKDLSISIATASRARLGTPFGSVITIKNNGSTAQSSAFQLHADPFLILQSPSGMTPVNGIYYFNPGILNPGQIITVTLTWTTPPSVSIANTIMLITAELTLSGDQLPADNSTQSSTLITYSYDPNQITVAAQFDAATQQAYDTDLLQYDIEFQNTGTDYAEDIVIIDTLPAGLDPSTLEIKGSSHAYRWNLSGTGVLTFTFENIMLLDSNANEPASHGYISYQIRHRSLAIGTEIENEANIYFDLNAPVLTNTAVYKITGPDYAQTIQFTAVADTIYNDTPYIMLDAVATSGLEVSYAASGPVTLVNDKLYLDGTGSVLVGAYQEGDENFNPAYPKYIRFVVSTRKQTLSFGTLPDKITTDAPFSLTATGGASGNQIVYTIVSGPAAINNNEVTLTGAGTVVVQVSQAGNTYYSAATSLTQQFNVTKATQTILSYTVPTKATTDLPFDLTFSGGASANLIVYTVVSGPATVAGNTVTLSGQAGTVIIEATQLGDNMYADAPAVQISFDVLQVTATHGSVDATVSAWPNPCVGNLNISMLTAGSYEVLNAQGKLIMSGECAADFNIDLSSLPAGVYTLKIISGEKVSAVSVVKQ